MTALQMLGVVIYETLGPVVTYTAAILTAFLLILVVITSFDELV